ncbi:hypothetical protein BDW42DRAFT_188968 [Aspergillus taichungensis]|uniref:Uncharacterized protein n=1 Tax=Aspergillus taichungensis TaxID=482145 RepID=A0A2J5HG95_9EURO|nr:hypothetical protein BDW42DRAFT_188968 [Aspergillus taichungensis]
MMEVSNFTRSLPSVEKKFSRLSESVARSDEDHQSAELFNHLECQKCAPATGDWLLNTAQYMKSKTNPSNSSWIRRAGQRHPQLWASSITDHPALAGSKNIKAFQDYCGEDQSSSLYCYFMDASEERRVDISRVYGS